MPATRRLSPLAADGLMLLAALIWGSGFIAQRLGAEHLDAFAFTGLRFALGAALLGPWVIARGLDRAHLVAGLVTGGVMATAALFQQWGLQTTTAGNGAFITSLYVIIVPFLGLALGQHIRPNVWVAVALALVGMWYLCIDSDFTYNRGDPIVFVCAVGWAFHLVVVGRYSPTLDPLRYAFLQFAVTGVVALALSATFNPPSVEQVVAAKWALIFSGVLAVCVAFSLQMIAQRTAPPTHAAIILSLESVFGMVCGAIFLKEAITGRKIFGAALMFVAMVLAQMGPSSKSLPAAKGDEPAQ
ncbi:MAG: DMT family transporter [Phycisphaerae bacterium]|nr:DMT family transporter [Phycisphaerae bacterium]